jgi:hypothetical protein
MQHKYTDKRPVAAVDTECFHSYWSIEFRCVDTDRRKLFEIYKDHPLDVTGVATLLRNWRVVTFNGIYYDMPMIVYAMSGADNAELKQASDELILTGLKPWEFYDRYNLSLSKFIDHIDLMPVAPSAARMASLKLYAAMMHSRRVQDLPFPPDTVITAEHRPMMREYLGIDTENTRDLYHELKQQLDLRAEMSEKYEIDLRSKSDAQVAEAVIKHMVEKRTGRKIYKPDIEPKFFNYVAPAYIKFKTPGLQQALSTILRTKFRVKRDGYVDGDFLKQIVIEIGGRTYQMGIGGLHSQEESVSHYSDEEGTLRDRDVTSYYPEMIVKSGRAPSNMGQHFQIVYQSILKERKAAKKRGEQCKKAGDKVGEKLWKTVAESMKIMLNGVFGKTGSPFSVVYSPELMIFTTVTGQLSMLMLIEAFVLAGFKVISANTDGVITKVPDERYQEFDTIVFDWELVSGLGTEETVYRSVHSRDVNTYVAFAEDEKEPDGLKAKRKGADFTEPGRGLPGASGLKKNPNMEISTMAVIAFLKNGTPIEQTVRACKDIRHFLVVRQVKGGGYKDGELIGKVVRYYYGDDTPGAIVNKDGARSADSEGACPCMELPDTLPDNIDYEKYEREAYAILHDIGVPVRDPAYVGRDGFTYARLPEQKNIHLLDLSNGRSICGIVSKSIRDPWVEYEAIPDGHRYCAKCRDFLKGL